MPFGGWDMPVQYSGILAEVNAVRTRAGVFDVSHMGRLYISGPKATKFLDWVLTGSAQSLAVSRARYCMICNEDGGVIDDTIFYRLAEHRYLLIPNAGNRDAVLQWFHRWIDAKFPGECLVDDRTEATALIALQGPQAVEIMDGLCVLDSGAPPSSLRPFAWAEGKLAGDTIFMGRTGYTGEDGFEVSTSAAHAPAVWQSFLDAGALPCGLGARDVLRLEAGLPLHGHEIDERTTPVEAGPGTLRALRQRVRGVPGIAPTTRGRYRTAVGGPDRARTQRPAPGLRHPAPGPKHRQHHQRQLLPYP